MSVWSVYHITNFNRIYSRRKWKKSEKNKHIIVKTPSWRRVTVTNYGMLVRVILMIWRCPLNNSDVGWYLSSCSFTLLIFFKINSFGVCHFWLLWNKRLTLWGLICIHNMVWPIILGQKSDFLPLSFIYIFMLLRRPGVCDNVSYN